MFSNGDHKEDLQNKETDEFEEDNALEDDSNNFALDGEVNDGAVSQEKSCLLYTSPSPRDGLLSRMPSSA